MQKLRLSPLFIIIFFTISARAQNGNFPLRIGEDSSISVAGHRMLLSKQGFPEQVQVLFAANGKDSLAKPVNILAENIHFHFFSQADGKDIRLKSGGLAFTKRTSRKVSWEVNSAADALSVDATGTVDPKGRVDYSVKVTALRDLDLKDIVMHIPFQKEVAKSMVGLGKQGDYQPDSMYHWKAKDGNKEGVGAWIGDAGGAGLNYSLLNPTVWYNGGKGGIDVGIKGKSMLVNNYSGSRHLSKGDILYYNFILRVSPDRMK